MKSRLMSSPLIFILLTVLTFAACGVSTMMITVKRPAEINLKAFEKIAIGDITNEGGTLSRHAQDMRDEITATLFNSNYFDVLDRQHLDALIKEHKLNLSGFIDESTAAELGEFIGAAALVFGRIQADQYAEDLTKGRSWTDKKGNVHQLHFRKGTYNLAVNIKIVDMQTARIVAVKTLSAVHVSRKSGDNTRPPKIDKQMLYSRCMDDIKTEFLKLVAPYEETVRAFFQKDKQLPEVEEAIVMFKIGEWDTGMELFKKATRKHGLKPKVLAKSYYNLGLAQTYRGEYENALINLKKALRLNPQNRAYLTAVNRAKEEKENADKLKEQM